MSNRLASATSPYLQQHADNPVDWQPWDEEALAAARRDDKPILLSIGYSSCHWCHVMAHESFEDPATADVMNRLFINIKVDREERPDLDQIYQAAHQMLTGRPGGWPLNMFLTPEGVPFFGGTYFPGSPRHGMPGFADLLARVAGFYREQRDDIDQQNSRLLSAFSQTQPAPAAAAEPGARALEAAHAQLAANFDRVYGGFGGAPKFPHSGEIELCLRRAANGDGEALQMARATLDAMAEGGLYDHLGGGFFRYCVDDTWTIPHFEKMLYDNGPLLRLYSDAWLATREPRFEAVARETVDWVLREMRAPEGGFYSTLDADSEHEEGKFYVWTPEEAKARLSPQEYAVAARVYGLDRAANFEGRHWHLRLYASLDESAAQAGVSREEAPDLLASARAKLFRERERRVRPGRDEKVLTAWNALMIRGLARAARVFAEPAWLAAARSAVDFLRARAWRDGRLLAVWKDGEARLNGYLDDYAFLLDALLELLQTRYRQADLAFARDLAESLLERFEDRQAGGFFFTSHDHERLIHRPKSGYDNATPSGNAVAAFALQRLGHLLGETRYLDAAGRTVRLFGGQAAEHPAGLSTLLTAVDEYLDPPAIAIVRGDDGALGPWREALAGAYLPRTVALIVSDDEADDLPPALTKPASASPRAWMCRGDACLPPVDDPQELLRLAQGT